MPSKSKGAPRAREQAAASANASTAAKSKLAVTTLRPEDAQTVNERSRICYELGNPVAARKKEAGGLHALAPDERSAWANLTFVRRAEDPKRLRLTSKANKDVWRSINELGVPIRALDELDTGRFETSPSGGGKPVGAQGGSAKSKVWDWGTDRVGRDLGEYSPQEFTERKCQRLRITRLLLEGKKFERARRAKGGLAGLSDEELDKEEKRRQDLARLRMALYGKFTGSFEQDPEWDDVVPIAQEEGEGELATIAYSDEYAEAMSYLRAVMANKEHSPRCLRLTETLIGMNPAHYTVWLYRFDIVSALNISIPDEIEWLNRVSLAHLKNYQIWHHRQLLVDHYCAGTLLCPAGGSGDDDNDKGKTSEPPAGGELSEQVKKFTLAELAFIRKMLDEDAKNYHVWTYHQYLVRKLSLWDLPEEMEAVETLILEDVRNNSAWSHRFFLVFSNPKQSTTDPNPIPATRHDPKVPAEVVDREIEYTTRKIEDAPMNQSPWNYLKGILARGGRSIADVRGFCEQFAQNIGDEENEMVKSTHAMEMLAEIHAVKGEKEAADKVFRRLAERWDRIREGYWNWRRLCIQQTQ